MVEGLGFTSPANWQVRARCDGAHLCELEANLVDVESFKLVRAT